MSRRELPSRIAAGGQVARAARCRVGDVGVEYLDAGAGPTLVLLHGHEQTAATWRWVMPALARTHRVVALSLPGHGDTDPYAGHAPEHDLAPFVAAFLDTLGLDTVDLVGHSAGGVVATRLALTAPGRVRTLTLVDSAGLGHHVNPWLALDTAPGLGEMAIALSRLPGGAMSRSMLSAAMLFALPWRAPAEFLVEAHVLGARPGQLEASTATARRLFGLAGQRDVLLDRLHELPMPTLVVWGALDYVLPAYQAAHAVRRLRRGRLEVLPGCGHLPHVERPARFAEILTGFITGRHDVRARRPEDLTARRA